MKIEMNPAHLTPPLPIIIVLAAGTLFFPGLSAHAEQRAFTNAKGQEIIAEIVSAKDDTVVLTFAKMAILAGHGTSMKRKARSKYPTS